MYVVVFTRLDLAQVVSVVSKFMANPSRPHWNVVKSIFKNLMGITDYGIIFASQQDDPSVVGYADANYIGELDYRR